jgi:hypothetical protein
MKRKTDDSDNTTSDISSRTSVKLPIWYIAGAMVSFSLFLYAQLELHKRDDDRRFENIHTYIEEKSADRYTSSQARQHTESIKQRLLDIDKANETTHESFQRQLDRHSREIATIRENR